MNRAFFVFVVVFWGGLVIPSSNSFMIGPKKALWVSSSEPFMSTDRRDDDSLLNSRRSSVKRTMTTSALSTAPCSFLFHVCRQNNLRALTNDDGTNVMNSNSEPQNPNDSTFINGYYYHREKASEKNNKKFDKPRSSSTTTTHHRDYITQEPLHRRPTAPESRGFPLNEKERNFQTSTAVDEPPHKLGQGLLVVSNTSTTAVPNQKPIVEPKNSSSSSSCLGRDKKIIMTNSSNLDYPLLPSLRRPDSTFRLAKISLHFSTQSGSSPSSSVVSSSASSSGLTSSSSSTSPSIAKDLPPSSAGDDAEGGRQSVVGSTHPIDWREYRARLVKGGAQTNFAALSDKGKTLLERRALLPNHDEQKNNNKDELNSQEIRPSTNKDDQLVWAHDLSFIEPGCVLLSALPRQAAVMVVHADPPSDTYEGSMSGLLLGEYCCSLNLAAHSLPTELADSPLFTGGPHGAMRVYLVHNHLSVAGAKELVPGIYVGGSVDDAAALVRNGAADPADFQFYVQHVRWRADEVSKALSTGQWRPIACSPSVIFHTPTKTHSVDIDRRGDSRDFWTALQAIAIQS